MANPAEFARNIKKIADTIQPKVTTIVRRVALAIDQTVVLATPVDTGRARANWQVELNQAATGQREPFAPGQHGSTGRANIQGAIEQGAAKIAEYKVDEHHSIHITNNLPYIRELNEGSSAQAPSGFVQLAIQAGIKSLDGQKILVK